MSQSLYVVGPNLRDQSKGSFHVHDANCGDMQRMARRDSAFAMELRDGRPVEFKTQVEVAEYVYDNGIMTDDETGEDYLFDFHFAPCVKIPVR